MRNNGIVTCVILLAGAVFTLQAYRRHFEPHSRVQSSSTLLEPMQEHWISQGRGVEAEFETRVKLRDAILTDLPAGSQKSAVENHLRSHYKDFKGLKSGVGLSHPGGPSERVFYSVTGYYHGHGVGSSWIEVRYWISKEDETLDEIEILFREGWS